MSIIIYHNPRCSKSRATLALLQERGIDPDIVLYLKDPPSPEQLSGVLGKLGMRPRELLRTGDPAYAAAGMDAPALSDDELIELMCEHPSVIQRPVVIAGDAARIGRPPEQVLEIL
ncbi:MAG: arsenate reductase (glutaredoxin) [Pseudomonadota bacterium]